MPLTEIVTSAVYTFRDRENTLGRSGLYLPIVYNEAYTAQGAIDKALAMADLIAPLSDCQLVDVTLNFQATDEAAVGTGEVESKGFFVFNVAGGTDYVTGVPSIKDTLLDIGSRRDITISSASPPEVLAFLDAVILGPTGANNGATNSAGRDLVRCSEAWKEHIGSLQERRGRSG